MRPLINQLANRAVGTVEEVSAGRIIVLLDPDAPQATALNTGTPERFPRVNGYLVIPNEVGMLVGWITSVRIERLPFPRRKGIETQGLVDLPFPCRIVDLIPIGTLVWGTDRLSSEPRLECRRGVDVFPSVGDPVLLPTHCQLQAIVQGEVGQDARRIQIGVCPIAGNAPVYVDPDKMFGRHLAVLGNTGSGKSCSVAGLIRWSLEAAKEERQRQGGSGSVNARFIILDPNGEYASAFKDQPSVRLFQVKITEGDHSLSTRALKVPAWLWNGEEWAAFTDAAPGVQKPILFEALRRLRADDPSVRDPFKTRMRSVVGNYRRVLNTAVKNGDHMAPGKCRTFAQQLLNLGSDCEAFREELKDDANDLRDLLQQLIKQLTELEESHVERDEGNKGIKWCSPFAYKEVSPLISMLNALAEKVGLPLEETGISEDAPVPFEIGELSACVDALAAGSQGRDLTQFVDFLKLRIYSLTQRESLAPILNPTDSCSITLKDWLTNYIGDDKASNGQISIIDLSLVPTEVEYIIVAVLARLVFEALQWYRRINGKELPTVLVLEEAHRFVHRDLPDEDSSKAGQVCCRVFERIAREGRKFGLGLVLASQRPRELSPTVLSQCNTFLLHRIVNDQDQDLVRRFVPDRLGTLLKELPNLPSRRAILLGWAVPAPVLIEMQELDESRRPHSPDPAFWDVWTGHPERGHRPIDWQTVSAKWTGNSKPTQSKDCNQ